MKKLLISILLLYFIHGAGVQVTDTMVKIKWWTI